MQYEEIREIHLHLGNCSEVSLGNMSQSEK